MVKTKKLDMGLGCDLDGDRFGIIDKDGSFVGTDEVICVILEHLIKTRKGYSSVAKSLATTAMVDRIASANGMKIVETPVGFKYIAEELLKGNCLMGAEESGGISIGGHVPEKDGILACLLALEACALNKKGIRAIFKDITKKYGRLYFERRGLLLRSKAKLFKRLDRFKPKAISGASVLDIEKTDGYKFKFSDGSWLLIRPSGTEPIVRLYAEASSKRMVQGLLRKAETLINNK